MKRTFLSKLQRNGLYCTIGAFLLLLGVPLYQYLILIPSGYSNAIASQGVAPHWINTHILQFLGYRVLLIAGFALIISLPFTLFRIIVAQEILGRDYEKDGRRRTSRKGMTKSKKDRRKRKIKSSQVRQMVCPNLHGAARAMLYWLRGLVSLALSSSLREPWRVLSTWLLAQPLFPHRLQILTMLFP